MKLFTQLAVVSALGAIALGIESRRSGDFSALWLTPNQQGRLAYENLEFSDAADLFENPAWKGTAEYRAGRYTEAADTFARSPSAGGFYNRGNAFMKGREYGKSITAYEQAVAEAPEWTEASENLQLSRYVLEYIEGTREQQDTGDETELGADDYKFDNTRERGLEMIITQQSTIEMESADKWMRSVDTEISDFLRTRFELEATRVVGQ
jgi:Ca-activated chloride channel family protein